MDQALIWLVTGAAVAGIVLELFAARESHWGASQLFVHVRQKALQRSTREMMVGAVLLVCSAVTALFLLHREHDQRLALETQVARMSDELAVVNSRRPTPPITGAVTAQPAEATVALAVPVPSSSEMLDAKPVEDRSDDALESVQMRVAVDSLRLRSTPTGAVIRTLRLGERLRLMQESRVGNKRWALVNVPQTGEQGWVSRTALTPDASQS